MCVQSDTHRRIASREAVASRGAKKLDTHADSPSILVYLHSVSSPATQELRRYFIVHIPYIYVESEPGLLYPMVN